MTSWQGLPQEIVKIDQWTHSYGIGAKELKRPKHTHYTPNGSLSFNDALRVSIESGYIKRIGFYVTEEDPYILGDIDHVDYPEDKAFLLEILPIPLSNILFNMNVYSEISPSGRSIRFIARLKDIDTKGLLDGKYFKNRIKFGDSELDVDEKGQPREREAQFHIGRPWNTITGNTLPYSSNVISVVELEDLEDVFKLRFRSDDPLADVGQLPADTADKGFPSMSEVVNRLRSLPWNRNPRLKRAYKQIFGEEYSDYEYWLKILMAVSDYAAKSPNKAADELICLEELDKWSSRDSEGYSKTGTQGVVDKWRSFQRMENKVSYHTLFALSHAITLQWPAYKLPTDKQIESGITSPVPIISEYVNFRAMVQFYGLKLHQDAHSSTKVYVSGDEDIIKKYLTHMDVKVHYDEYYGPWEEDTLVSKFHIMCQEEGMMGLSRMGAKQNILNWLAEMSHKIDLVRLYFDTPFGKLPQKYQENAEYQNITTVEYIFSCLDINFQTNDVAREKSLYFKYYRSWLMGIPRGLYNMFEGHMNNCVLLLTGPEQIYKTTHFKRMFPNFMREERVCFTPHGFSTEAAVRDVTKLAAANTFVVWDEIEQYLTSETESNFKKLIDNNPIQVIDKYNTLASYVRPIAIYGGTSNKDRFNLSDTGNRRLFHIPVHKVDTTKLNTVNWHTLINDLHDEMMAAPAGLPPWLLTEEELDFQLLLHKGIRKKNSLDMMLDEVYDFTAPFPYQHGDNLGGMKFYEHPEWKSVMEVSKRLTQASMGEKINKPALVNALYRSCGTWTGTERQPKVFDSPRMVVKKGEIHYNGRTKFWMPPEQGRKEW